MKAFDVDTLSLRPMGSQGAGGNPFATFSKGAGFSASGVSLTSERRMKHEEKVEISIRYPKEFLTQFSTKCTRVPPELQFSGSELLLPDDEEQRAHKAELVQKVVTGDVDTWKAGGAEPQPAAAVAPPTGARPSVSNSNSSSAAALAMKAASAAQARPGSMSGAAASATKIEKAADRGRMPWAPTLASTDADRSLRVIKGALNKLTPEKFDRLLQQILGAIQSGPILEATIPLVFEKAVAEPTFCALYADLCKELSQALPEFPGAEGDGEKPVTFRRSLLNSCQDEFEGMTAARSELLNGPPSALAERKAKMRILGTMRLIAELFKAELVVASIMQLCIQRLLAIGVEGNGVFVDDYIEAVCEMITCAGKQLNEGRGAKHLATHLTRLEELASHPNMSSRIKFLVRDIGDLRRAGWVPRRETFTAKKLDAIRSEAQAELGMVESTFDTSFLDDLPGIATRRAEEDVELFPAFRTAPEPAQRPVAAPLTPEECSSKTVSMMDEYLAVGDLKEVLTCAEELPEEFMPRLVEMALARLLVVFQSREQEALIAMVHHLHKEGALKGDEAAAVPLREACSQLDDSAVDVPAAPLVYGKLVGLEVAAGLLPVSFLAEACGKIEDTEIRRKFGAGALQAVQGAAGDDGLGSICSEGGFSAVPLFDGDPEFDPPGLPSTLAWLADTGLACVPTNPL